MTDAPLLLGIDEGTTAVKVALFDAELRPLREARRRVPVQYPQPGWVEKDPLAILDAVVSAVADVLADAPGEVVAAGLAHEGESVLAWDAASGAPLTPVIVWQDKRAASVLAELDDEDVAAIRRLTGLPPDPYFSAGKLAWLLRHRPAVAAAAAAGTLRLGTVDAFLCDRLGAGFATDPSTASRTMLHALRTPGWDPWLCERFGVPLAALPAVMDTVGDLGVLSHPSWPCDLPLRTRICDQQAALAGNGCVVPGAVKATYGTGVFVLANVGDDLPDPIPGGLLPTVAWRIGGRDTFALDGGVFAAGAMLDWLCAELGLAADAAALGELARSVPDAGGARVLPALAGLGAPWWDPHARAVISGITGATTQAHIARGAFEGLAWRVADIVEAIREAVPVRDLRVDGGLTNEPLLLELQARAIGADVGSAGADATALGVSALAAVGAGLLEDVAAISARTAADRTTPGAGLRNSAEHDRWQAFAAAAGALR
jgi:glycerol kinase